jgi:hypothetical protein
MDIVFKTRQFYPEELRLLKTLRSQKVKEGDIKFRVHYLLIAGILGVGFTYITTLIPDSFWTFIFGTLAVVSFSFIFLVPYSVYTMRSVAESVFAKAKCDYSKRNS